MQRFTPLQFDEQSDARERRSRAKLHWTINRRRPVMGDVVRTNNLRLQMSDVLQLTDKFRNDSDFFWSQLRSAVLAQGVEPETTFLVESCEQGDMSEFGILVTRNGSVFQYALFSETKSWADGNLIEWTNITDRWSGSPYQQQVEQGMKLARSSV